MKAVTIVSNSTKIHASIELPLSKSISNRVLILKQVLKQTDGWEINIPAVSDADDTNIMQRYCEIISGEVNIENAGTCLRFLSALYAATPGTDIIMRGNQRMKERPIKPLFDALESLGAILEYQEEEGYLPVRILGSVLNGGEIKLDASVSSQFISAIMMIAPLTKKGINISWEGKESSSPYISMTASVMNKFGFLAQYHPGKSVSVKSGIQSQIPSAYIVERDWSSAAFFYEAALLADEARIFFPGLMFSGIQGDENLASIFKGMGIESIQLEKGIEIHRRKLNYPKDLTINFSECPDLAPAVICATAGAGIPLTANGLNTLVYKESNRLMALVEALKRFQYGTSTDDKSFLTHDALAHAFYTGQVLSSYQDHRLVMAYSIMALLTGIVKIDEVESVSKSFPAFYNEAEKLGIKRVPGHS